MKDFRGFSLLFPSLLGIEHTTNPVYLLIRCLVFFFASYFVTGVLRSDLRYGFWVSLSLLQLSS